MTQLNLSEGLRARIRDFVGEALSTGDEVQSLYGTPPHPSRMEGYNRWEGILLSAAIEAREAGLARPFPNGTGHDAFSSEEWDDFVRNGIEDGAPQWRQSLITHGLTAHMGAVVTAFLRDPSGAARAARPWADPLLAVTLSRNDGIEAPIRDPGPEHAERITDLIIRELSSPRLQLVQATPAEARSEIDGGRIDVSFDGWAPVVLEVIPKAEKTNVSPRYRVAGLPDIPPPIRHYAIPVPSGRLAVFSSSDTEEGLQEKLHRSGVRGVGLPSDFSANTGVNAFMLNLYEATGAVQIHFGDYFPKVALDGDVYRGTNAVREDIAEAGLRPLTLHSLEDPVFMDMGELSRFLHEPEVSVSRLNGRIYDMEMEQLIRVIDVPDGVIHLYAPDGWRADDFANASKWKGMSEVADASDFFLLSPEPVPLPEGTVLDVELPARPELAPDDVPDYGTGPS